MIDAKTLKQRIDEILVLCRAAHNAIMADYNSVEAKAADVKFWEAITALDKEAVSGLGPKDNRCVPGRLVKFAVADNYARYIILRVNKKTCKVVHLPYMDAYRSPAVNGE